MNRILKSFLVLLAVLIVLAGGLILYIYSNQSLVTDYFLKKANEQLRARISIGQIDMELFEQFPNVSLDLRDVRIDDPEKGKKHLLDAQHVYIGFNVYDILSRTYHIRLITFDSGSCNLFTDRKGRSNYEIFKESTDTVTANTPGNAQSLFVKLTKVQLHNVKINYVNQQSEQHYSALAKDVELSGSFSDAQHELSCKGELFTEKVQVGSMHFLKDKKVELDLALVAEQQKGLYRIRKGALRVDELQLELQGSIRNNPKDIFTDLQFSARQLSITGLLSLLPFKMDALGDYQSSGDIYFKGTIKGTSSAKAQPLVRIDFGISNGRLKRASTGLDIDRIHCRGHFESGKNLQQAFLELKDLSVHAQESSMMGDLSIRNFKASVIDAQLDGLIKTKQLISLLNNPNIESADGEVQFNVTLKGRLDDFTNKNNWQRTHAAGNFNMELQHVRLKGAKEIESLHAALMLDHNDIDIAMFECKMQQSDVNVHGKLVNVIPYLLLDGQKLEADITYRSDYVDLEHFMLPVAAAAPATAEEKSKNSKTPALQLPEHISVNADVMVNKLKFHHFNANDLRATIHWKGKKLQVENATCNTMNGTISVSGQVENAADGRFLITSAPVLHHININELFRQCNNFGQTELTDKHLFGTLDAKVEVASVWSPQLDCDLDRLFVSGGLQITNGELVGYQPLEVLSTFVDVKELRHLKFAELKNTITISNQVITIPAMDMNNNALNISLSGTHTFENYMDYRLRIRISELLKKKRTAEENEFGEEEENGKGMNLYLTMKGPAGNLKFKYDKAAVKTKIKQDVKTEQRNVGEALKKELGIGKDSTIREKQNDNDELEFEQE